MLRIILSALLLVSISLPVHAEGEHVRGEILSAYKSVGTFATLDMGLQLSLDDPWYTYWRTPGDAGLAPVMDWSGSENVKDVKVLWPTPKRFTAFDMYSFGYNGTVVLPLQITPVNKGEAVTVILKLDIVACHEICIPQTLKLEKFLPEGPARSSTDGPVLARALKALPANKDSRDLAIDTVVLAKEAITIIARSSVDFGPETSTDVFVDSPDVLLTMLPEVMAQESDKKAVIRIKAPQGEDLTGLLGKKMTIVLHHGNFALEKEISF